RPPEAGRRLRERGETRALHETAIHRLDAIEDLRLVHRQHLPAFHHETACDHDIAHILAGRVVHKAIDGHVERREVRLRQVYRDQIRLLPGFYRPQLALAAEPFAAVYGRHLQRLAARDEQRIPEMYPLLVDRGFHVEKDVAVVRRGHIRAQTDRHAGLDQLGHRTPPRIGIDPCRARVMRSVGAGLPHDGYRASGDPGAMRKYGARSEQAELLVVRVFDRVAVHVGPEAGVVPDHEIAHGFRLPAYPALLFRIPDGIVLVAISDPRKRETVIHDAAPPPLREQTVTVRDDLVETDQPLGLDPASPVGIGARPWGAGRPYADPGAQANALELPGCGMGEDHVVRARAVPAHHGEHAGRAELETLQRAQLGIDLPPLLIRCMGQHGIEHPAAIRAIQILANRLQQAAAEVAVQVDHAGQDCLTRAVERLRRAMLRRELRDRSDIDDPTCVDRYGCPVPNAARPVHRDHESVLEQ